MHYLQLISMSIMTSDDDIVAPSQCHDIVACSSLQRYRRSLGAIDSGPTYDVHLGHIGKRVVDFLLVLTELFWLDVTAESLRSQRDRNRRFAPTRSV